METAEEKIIKKLSEELSIKEEYVKNVIGLLDEGNTLPFIARYRKEMHGSLDDTTLRTLYERRNYLNSLEERRNTILNAIEEQGKLTEELREAIGNAETLAVLEDLYRPYKQKRSTRASKAREKGLEPLADLILSQDERDPYKEAETFIDEEKGVLTVEDAINGARDIIAEDISDNADFRGMLRQYMFSEASLHSVLAGEEESVYGTYRDFTQKVTKIQGHQVLAVNRGEKEGFLKVTLELDHDKAKEMLVKRLLKGDSLSAGLIREASEDAYERLIRPSLERELRSELTSAASEGAIKNFAVNLKALLLQRPVKGKVTMGLDPGYRNGCKVAVIDETGKVLDTAVVYPTFGEAKKQEAIKKLSVLIRKHGVEHIAIGNGTASRETEAMAAEMIRGLNTPVSYAIVNEAGASVYSASPLAAEEFPDYDVNLRSAVSIARRLQDPLAELVKIEPGAIGVGQYQHDMPQARLTESLNGVVEDCVNNVGVNINTASPSLLMRVSGLNKTTAKNIVTYREENGAFTDRKQILKVPKLGPKAFEMCAGFLRVPESKEILDNTEVHPESYHAAKKILELCGYTMQDVRERRMRELARRIVEYGEQKMADECGIGIPTLEDIAVELSKPGRDIRDDLPPVVLRHDVLDISDLKPGMELSGTVRNVIDFGAFVDIGVHQDGLVHVSEISNRYIKHPSEVLTVGDIVKVVVLDVDQKKGRISLSMKKAGK